MFPNHKTSFKAVVYTEAFVNMKRGSELVWLYHLSQIEILVGTDFAIRQDEIPFLLPRLQQMRRKFLQKSGIDLNILALRIVGEHSEDLFFFFLLASNKEQRNGDSASLRNLRSYLF